MALKTKQQSLAGLLVFMIFLVAGKVNGAPLRVEEAVRYCPKNDSTVKVSAHIENITLRLQEQNQIGFKAQAIIRITNRSSEDVFVLSGGSEFNLDGEPHYGAISLSRTKEDALSCDRIYNRGLYPSIDRRPYWQKLRKELDQETPSRSVIRTIAPGSYWEFEREILFGMWRDPLDDKHALEQVRKDPHVWLQIELLMWPNNLEKDMVNPVFGRSLQGKWKRDGRLIIDNLETEPVEVTLPLN